MPLLDCLLTKEKSMKTEFIPHGPAFDAKKTPSPKTWEPTMRLRWKERTINLVDSKTAEWLSIRQERELQQQWRCLETGETKRDPIPVEP